MLEEHLKGDAELIADTAAGDRAAFDALVARHQAAVYRFAYALTRDEATAEDAMQETFLSAWKGASAYRGDAAVRSWLFTIVRHAVGRQHRKRVGEPEDFATLEELGARAGWGSQEDPEALAIRSQNRGALGRALQSLSQQEREILVLRDLEGFSGEESSRILEIPIAAMKTRLHRARLRLAAALRKEPV